jgi:hypothetical protein
MSGGIGIRAWPRRQAALLALILLAGGCATAAPPPGTPTGPSAADGPAVPPELATFCRPAVDLIEVLEDGPDISTGATPERVAAAMQEFQARFEPPLVAVEQNIPDAVEQDVGTLGRQARYAVATKMEAPLDTPEYESALTRTRITVTGQCALMDVRVTSTEYKYEGMPSDVRAGAISVTLINLGAEPHELDVYKIDDNERRPFKELMGLPEAERGRALVLTENGPDADPGGTETMLLKLPPGRYGAACRIPQGSTSVVDGTGPPHATLGETAEFTVR